MTDRSAGSLPVFGPVPQRVNVLLIGTGGREHALAWKLRQSPRLGDLWIEPGANAGLARLGTPCPKRLHPPFTRFDDDILRDWCDEVGIGLVIVGPEVPLANGLADMLQKPERPVFGPLQAAARLEADKAFAKRLMRTASVPTAEGRIFDDRESALHYLSARADDEACVVKAAGLAAGKGVTVCADRAEAIEAVESIMGDRVFGDAGATVVIEERLEGQEVSVIALVDGSTIAVLDPCQDHKQVGEGDIGPNTGGMGAYCPAPLLDDAMRREIERDVLIPTIDALKLEDVPFRGVLYAGIMLTPAGPKVLEFNVRFGDPECQPLMARLRSDLVELLHATAAGRLAEVDTGIEFDPRPACTVVLCAEGYPGPYRKGDVITGIERAEAMEDVFVFHAGTARNADGELVTNGGRVLGVTALGDDLREARDRANEAAAQIHFDGAFYRHDIGDRVLVADA